jgi:hypothetical protein
MAARKISKAKGRKSTTRAKATRKVSTRSARKSPRKPVGPIDAIATF